jgi:hypothetical protein
MAGWSRYHRARPSRQAPVSDLFSPHLTLACALGARVGARHEAQGRNGHSEEIGPMMTQVVLVLVVIRPFLSGY